MAKRKKDKVSMPASSAGLIRYMDEEGRGIKLKPEHVAYAAATVIIAKIILYIS
ncbi:MAG: preprotein translocase subunit Sec61beta [Candidatus Hydrothermarchaeales archaeon]